MTLPPNTGPTEPAGALPARQRVLALSGVVFGVLLILAWFLSGGDAPDYTAADEDWAAWADDNRVRSGVGGFLILLAGVAFLHFAGSVRRTLANGESRVRGSEPLADFAFGGALVGIAGIGIALVTVASATSDGSDADPVAIRAVASASAGPYLVAAMGFAALLGAAGVSTLRSGCFPRWTGVVALLGAVGFMIAFLTLLAGLGEDSLFGYGFLPGILGLVIWSVATSISQYRAAGH